MTAASSDRLVLRAGEAHPLACGLVAVLVPRAHSGAIAQRLLHYACGDYDRWAQEAEEAVETERLARRRRGAARAARRRHPSQHTPEGEGSA